MAHHSRLDSLWASQVAYEARVQHHLYVTSFLYPWLYTRTSYLSPLVSSYSKAEEQTSLPSVGNGVKREALLGVRASSPCSRGKGRFIKGTLQAQHLQSVGLLVAAPNRALNCCRSPLNDVIASMPLEVHSMRLSSQVSRQGLPGVPSTHLPFPVFAYIWLLTSDHCVTRVSEYPMQMEADEQAMGKPLLSAHRQQRMCRWSAAAKTRQSHRS